MACLGDHAVVIGGSIAGLITARVLTDYFSQITVLERDQIEDRPTVHKSIPQGNHLHGLLQGGQQVLSWLYPGFADELRELGATRVTVGRDIVWYLPDGKAYNPSGSLREPFDSGLEAHCASRGLIEFLIRRRTIALPNIRFESGCTVRNLVYRNGRICGVLCDDLRSYEAELVVDATGRTSHSPRWLAALGFPKPRETEIGLDTAYSTANFRMPASYAGEPLIFITGPAPRFSRRGYVITIEDGTLLVSLIGRFGDYAPTDEKGFLAFARELHSDIAAGIIEEAEQLTRIAHHRFVSSVQRHYELMESFPEGFLVIGDALCTFNPIYAQGMSVAARHAQLLHEILAERAAQSRGLDRIASSFFPKAADLNSTPWNLAAAFDFAFPQTRGERPPGIQERARYFAALDELQLEDLEVRRLVTEVFQLLRPLSVLQEEPLRSRVLARI
jgi:2-polyprenyl-6-methoxyphenol hydroxylase-like FAD-dependent oxidoreductase